MRTPHLSLLYPDLGNPHGISGMGPAITSISQMRIARLRRAEVTSPGLFSWKGQNLKPGVSSQERGAEAEPQLSPAQPSGSRQAGALWDAPPLSRVPRCSLLMGLQLRQRQPVPPPVGGRQCETQCSWQPGGETCAGPWSPSPSDGAPTLGREWSSALLQCPFSGFRPFQQLSLPPPRALLHLSSKELRFH